MSQLVVATQADLARGAPAPNHAPLYTERYGWESLNSLTYDARAYGFIGDGTTHPLSDQFASLAAAQAVYAHAVALTDETDWAALQAAINACFAAGGGTVDVPAGHALINRTISMQNMEGVRLTGKGRSNVYVDGTKLRWTGAAGGVLLNLNGIDYCGVEHVGFFGDNAAVGTNNTNIGIRALGNPTYDGSFFNTIDHCYFQNFAICIDLGSATDQVDTFTINKCWCYIGNTGTGVKVNSTNSLMIQIMHCTVTAVAPVSAGTAKGIHARAGSVKLFGCITANCKYGIYLDSNAAYSSIGIFAHHSEGDGYALYTTSTGNHQKAYPVTMTDCYVLNSLDGLFYLGSADMVYRLTGVNSDPAGGNDDITVPDDTQSVWIEATFQGTMKNVSGATVTNVPGFWGPQTTAYRPSRIAAPHPPYVESNIDRSVLASDHLIVGTNDSSFAMFTLPQVAAVLIGKEYEFSQIGAGVLIIAPSGTNKFYGAGFVAVSSLTLAQYASVRLRATSTGWLIAAREGMVS